MSEIEQLKAEKQELKEEIDFLKKELECSKKLRNRIQNDLLKSDRINDKLEVENKRLKEENEIRDNLSEKFRKEALSWANITNEYQKDKTKLEQTLQEIKVIAEKCDLCDDCTGIDDCERYCGDSAEPCATRQMNNILEIIRKAEEE